jgi:hypothetical protein
MEDYSFATPMAISGTYQSQRAIVQAGGLHGKANDIHSFVGDNVYILTVEIRPTQVIAAGVQLPNHAR